MVSLLCGPISVTWTSTLLGHQAAALRVYGTGLQDECVAIIAIRNATQSLHLPSYYYLAHGFQDLGHLQSISMIFALSQIDHCIFIYLICFIH